MEEISFEELRKAHLQEKHSPLLSPLAENYFDTYLQYLDKFYGELKEGFSIESAKTYENSKKVFAELVKLRCQKVILKAFKESKAGGVSTDGLTAQEKALYLSTLKLFAQYESELFSFNPINAGKNLDVLDVAPQQEQTLPLEEVKLVEVLTHLPSFVTPSGKAIGPLEKGATAEIDAETAKLLVEKGVAKLF